ncbi:MAG: phage holin family protein [Cyclobacteriaceae bacterium]|nr:phage holin family protein [Cyclobacteriaceae bacterium]
MGIDQIKDSILRFLKLDGILKSATGYLEARVELLKLEIREDVAKALARMMVYAVMLFAGTLVVVFFSIGVAQFINGQLASSYAGYLVVSGFYLVLLLGIYLLRTRLYIRMERHFIDLSKHKDQ